MSAIKKVKRRFPDGRAPRRENNSIKATRERTGKLAGERCWRTNDSRGKGSHPGIQGKWQSVRRSLPTKIAGTYYGGISGTTGTM